LLLWQCRRSACRSKRTQTLVIILYAAIECAHFPLKKFGELYDSRLVSIVVWFVKEMCLKRGCELWHFATWHD
jgi:hypothetical protein